MAHNITFNSITKQWEIMTVGAAWHNLGQIVDGAKTWRETSKLAGLDWKIEKRQLQYNGIEVPAWGLFRDDQPEIDKAFIASTTATFQPIQNEFMFAFLDTVIENDGGAHYEAAGSLNGGAQAFALVNIGAAFEIGNTGDRHETFLLFTEDRTGQAAAKCFLTSVRVVCANTLASALRGENAEQSVRFRHTKAIADKMVEAVNLFSGARMNVEMLKSKLERLAEREVTRETLTAVLDRLFPAKDKENTAQRENKLIDILKLYENNDHNMFPEIRGTGYNLLNAVTQYIDHFAPVRRTRNKLALTDAQIRSERALIGDGANFKEQAMDAILELTAFAPSRKKSFHTMPMASAPAPAPLRTFDDDNIIDAEIID